MSDESTRLNDERNIELVMTSGEEFNETARSSRLYKNT
jgi:hypothetical protein